MPLDVSDVFIMTFMILQDSYMEPTRVGSDKEASVLHPIAVKVEVWHQIGIDLVGPLKLTR